MVAMSSQRLYGGLVEINNNTFTIKKAGRAFVCTLCFFYQPIKSMLPNSCVPSVASDHRSSGKFPCFIAAEFLRPFGSKRTKFERGNSAELGNL